eukprot:scaffold118851_cov54-Cyclotella_meneghiniana.AAC.3
MEQLYQLKLLPTKIDRVPNQCIHLIIFLISRYHQLRLFRLILRKPASAKKKDIKDHPKKELKLRKTSVAVSHDGCDSSQSVYQLKNGDFAFVKRSNGSWTYAMLAHRSRGSSYEEEQMVFVLDEKGSSKVIDEKDWARFIRCLAESEDEITVERGPLR